MDALFTAASLTDLTTNISSMLVTFIGIGLLFLGFRYIKKVFGRG